MDVLSVGSDNNSDGGQDATINNVQPPYRHPDDGCGDNGVVHGPTVLASVEIGKTTRA
jgi:hypothetical protein